MNGNADGMLLTDDYAPSSYNLVEWNNVVDDNLSECGIVLPSHSSNAVTFDPTTFEVTAVNPTLGGVYGNVVRDNVADGNGTDKAPPQFGGGGSGSGIGLFASGPGSAVYNNLVVDNEASGNGLAGIAMHAHLPGGEDIDGNVFVHNKLGTNNVGGDGFDGPPGPTDFQTTGIAVYSAVVVHMVISHNYIHDNTYGIWLSNDRHGRRPRPQLLPQRHDAGLRRLIRGLPRGRESRPRGRRPSARMDVWSTANTKRPCVVPSGSRRTCSPGPTRSSPSAKRAPCRGSNRSTKT